MGRAVAQHAQVVDSLHDALSGKMSPDAVHDHACGERIVPLDNSLSQFQSAAAPFDLQVAVQSRQKTPRRWLIGQTLVTSSQMDVLVLTVAVEQCKRVLRRRRLRFAADTRRK